MSNTNAFSSSLRLRDMAMLRNDTVSQAPTFIEIPVTDRTTGNPSLLGLLGFLIPYTSTILTLCQFQGATPPYTLIGLSGDYYFLGAIAMVLAGIGEFILGNSMLFLNCWKSACKLTTIISFPNGGLHHLRLPLGFSGLHPRPHSRYYCSIRRARRRERCCVQRVSKLPQYYHVSTHRFVS